MEESRCLALSGAVMGTAMKTAMKGMLLRCALGRRLAGLWADRRGVNMVLVGFSIVPLVAVSGLAIDTVRGYTVKSTLQSAIDNALLAAAHDLDSDDPPTFHQDYSAPVTPTTRRDRVFDEFFRANFPEDFLAAHSVTYDLTYDSTERSLAASAMVTAPTTFMAVVGIHDMDVRASGMAYGENAGMELALVLDVTGSMRSDGKIGALRSAARDLIDIIYGTHDEIDNLFVSVVPYTTSVNINRPWTDPTPEGQTGRVRRDGDTRVDLTDPIHSDRDLFRAAHTAWLTADSDVTSSPYTLEPWLGCVEARHVAPTPYHAPVWSETYTVNGNEARYDTYVDETYNERTDAYDMTDVAPASEATRFRPFRYPLAEDNRYDTPHSDTGGIVFRIESEWENDSVGPNLGCPNNAILPLTQDRQAIENAIDNLEPWHRGGTMTNVGLVWGWRTLSPNWPNATYWPDAEQTFEDRDGLHDLPLPYSFSSMVKAVVIMTDGENQAYNWPGSDIRADYTPYGRVTDANLGTTSRDEARYVIDRRMAEVCRRMRNAGIQIYTVTFGSLSREVRGLFHQCASEPDNYFHAATNDDLRDVFREIGEQLTHLRLAL